MLTLFQLDTSRLILFRPFVDIVPTSEITVDVIPSHELMLFQLETKLMKVSLPVDVRQLPVDASQRTLFKHLKLQLMSFLLMN